MELSLFQDCGVPHGQSTGDRRASEAGGVFLFLLGTQTCVLVVAGTISEVKLDRLTHWSRRHKHTSATVNTNNNTALWTFRYVGCRITLDASVYSQDNREMSAVPRGFD